MKSISWFSLEFCITGSGAPDVLWVCRPEVRTKPVGHYRLF